LVSISGEAGSGKSSVIRHACASFTSAAPSCLVIGSKLDQYRRQPFGIFVQVVKELVLDVLIQTNAVVDEWCTALLTVLGGNGVLLTQMFPTLYQLIGVQPPVSSLPTLEAQDRLHLLLNSFLCCFCTAARPLVLVFDDVQWADANSLLALEAFVRHPLCRHVLIVIAFRTNEVTDQHPLTSRISGIRASGKKTLQLTCDPLSHRDFRHMVWDTLRCSSCDALTLSILLSQHAQGNPLLARQLLLQLHHDRLITYEPLRRKGHRRGGDARGGWRFNNAAFLSASVSLSSDLTEVVQLIVATLSTCSQGLLSVAACLGGQFNCATLCAVSTATRAQVLVSLSEATTKELITKFKPHPVRPCSTEDFTAGCTAPLPAVRALEVTEYVFVHDSIQQAAYLNMPAALKEVTHLRIAQLLLAVAEKDSDMMEARLFDIAHHFILCVATLSTAHARAKLGSDPSTTREAFTQCMKMSDLCLRASLKAKVWLLPGCADVRDSGAHGVGRRRRTGRETAVVFVLLTHVRSVLRESGARVPVCSPGAERATLTSDPPASHRRDGSSEAVLSTHPSLHHQSAIRGRAEVSETDPGRTGTTHPQRGLGYDSGRAGPGTASELVDGEPRSAPGVR
jgi:predicted ATPase